MVGGIETVQSDSKQKLNKNYVGKWKGVDLSLLKEL